MINIECTYCGQKIYTLEIKYCPYCHTSIRMEVYRIKKIQAIYIVNKKIREKQKDKSDYWDKEFIYRVYQEKKHLENNESETTNLTKIIIIAVALMVVAVIFPIGLALIGNNIELAPSFITILTVLLPIVSIIGIVLFFLPTNRGM